MQKHKINHADIKEWAKNYDGELFDGILCDPPYELGFMGKSWDSSGIAFDTEMWADLFKLVKPGGHLLAFSGSRTYHRMAVAIEDAGFEIRDMIEYIYGSGFPKSTNIYKQLMKQCTCGSMEAYDNRTEQDTEHDLRPMQDTDVPQTLSAKDEAELVLQSGVSEQSVHRTMQGQEPKESVEDGEESSVEGRSNLQASKGQLQGREVSEVSKEVSTNGEERRLHNAAQTSDGSTSGQATNENGSGTSQRPQPEQQPDREPCAFCQQWTAQTLRGYRGYGSALKPSHEPICFARKPIDGTLANNVLTHGTGGLNIDGTRVGTEQVETGRGGRTSGSTFNASIGDKTPPNTGRFPANLIHDGSDEVVGLFPDTGKAGNTRATSGITAGKSMFGIGDNGTRNPKIVGDNGGSASRFFYCAKSSKSERNAGLEGFEVRVRESQNIYTKCSVCGDWVDKTPSQSRKQQRPNSTCQCENPIEESVVSKSANQNHHPTVKPLSLTKYLANLIKPPAGGRLLVPFSGSGSEMIGALQAGWEYVEGVELTEEYIPIAEARIKYWLDVPVQRELL